MKKVDKIFNDINNRGVGGANKHKRLVQKLCEKVFKKRGYENQKEAMRDDLTYQGNDHREAIERLFKITISYLICAKEEASSTPKTSIAAFITSTLHEKARVEFIKRSGRNPRDEDDVLDLLKEIQDGIEAEMQLKYANRHRNNNNFKKMIT